MEPKPCGEHLSRRGRGDDLQRVEDSARTASQIIDVVAAGACVLTRMRRAVVAERFDDLRLGPLVPRLLDEREKALERIEQLFVHRGELGYVLRDPHFEALRAHPGWEEMLRRVGFPELKLRASTRVAQGAQV